MAKLSSLRANLELETEGVWIPYALGIEVKVARINTPAYTKTLRDLCRPHLVANQTRTDLPDDLMVKLQDQAMAKHVFLGLRGADDFPSFDEKTAYAILQDAEYHELRTFIVNSAVSSEHYRQREQQGEAQD